MPRHRIPRHNAVLTKDENERRVAGVQPQGRRVTDPPPEVLPMSHPQSHESDRPPVAGASGKPARPDSIPALLSQQ